MAKGTCAAVVARGLYAAACVASAAFLAFVAGSIATMT
jgi:hypothetical protein